MKRDVRRAAHSQPLPIPSPSRRYAASLEATTTTFLHLGLTPGRSTFEGQTELTNLRYAGSGESRIFYGPDSLQPLPPLALPLPLFSGPLSSSQSHNRSLPTTTMYALATNLLREPLSLSISVPPSFPLYVCLCRSVLSCFHNNGYKRPKRPYSRRAA